MNVFLALLALVLIAYGWVGIQNFRIYRRKEWEHLGLKLWQQILIAVLWLPGIVCLLGGKEAEQAQAKQARTTRATEA